MMRTIMKNQKFVSFTCQFLWLSFRFLSRGIYPIILLSLNGTESVEDHLSCTSRWFADESKSRHLFRERNISVVKFVSGEFIKSLLFSLPVQVWVYLRQIAEWLVSCSMSFEVFLILIELRNHYIARHPRHHHLLLRGNGQQIADLNWTRTFLNFTLKLATIYKQRVDHLNHVFRVQIALTRTFDWV